MTEEKSLKPRPKVNNSLAEQELDKAQAQLKEFSDNVNELTLDRMNQAPKLETEPQTKLSQAEIAKSKDIYLKPKRSLPPGVHPKTGIQEKFNERFRSQYDFAKEYVHFTAENNEIIGETIDIWTKPFPGCNCEWWEVPTNKPIWGPRYLAEQLKKKSYHRLKMENRVSGSSGLGIDYGTIAVDTTIQRLDAHPVSNRKSIFMGAVNF